MTTSAPRAHSPADGAHVKLIDRVSAINWNRVPDEKDPREIPPQALEGPRGWRAMPLAIRREGFTVDA